MATDEDVKRFISGKESWNRWAINQIAQAKADKRQPVAVDFSAYKFTKGASFSGFIFPGDASFEEATFVGSKYADRANFDDCKFLGEVTFYEATFDLTTFNRAIFSQNVLFTRCSFNDAVRFHNARFMGEVNLWEVKFQNNAEFKNVAFLKRAEFTQAKFKRNALFTGAVFSSGSSFENTNFAEPPDFLSAVFKVPPQMRMAQIVYATDGKWWQKILGCAKVNDDFVKYRRLKQLSQESRDHESTLRFLGQELKAKRFHETKGVALIPNILYGTFSNFGQSIATPLTWLLVTIVISAGCYTINARPWAKGVSQTNAIICGTYLSVTASGYLVGWEKLNIHKKSLACLGFGPTPREETADIHSGQTLAIFPIEVGFMFQSAIALLLFFLSGLALRNRFRIGGGDS